MIYDKDIREPLFEFLEEKHGRIRIIEEKNMGRSRADIVMVSNDALVGIEIKSDADTYARLSRQVKDYNRFFDYNIIVAGTSHANHVAEHVPDWWGIITVEKIEKKLDFYVHREIAKNPKSDIKKQLPFLWRPELAHIQELNGMAKYKEKSKRFVIDKILEKVEHETLKKQLCDELFERDYTTIAERIAEYKKTDKKNAKKDRGAEGYVYIVKCSDGTFYTGWTNNLKRRIATHNSGNGAKYTRSRTPVELVYYEEFKTKEEAMSREFQIKKMTRKQKEKLIQERI